MILDCENCGTKYNPQVSYNGKCPACRIRKQDIRQTDDNWIEKHNEIKEFRVDQMRDKSRQVRSQRRSDQIKWEREHGAQIYNNEKLKQ